MMRLLGKEVLKTFEVLPKRFISCLFKLQDAFPNLHSLVNEIELLQEGLVELSLDDMEPACTL